MKKLFLPAFGLLAYVACVFTFTTISAAFSQMDTTSKKKDSLSAVLQKKTVPELKKISSEKDLERDLILDSIAQNFETLGNLKPSIEQTTKNFKVAENNLTETILKSDGGVQAIEKHYRIDTSPRPIVINVIYPVYTPVKYRKRGWIFWRD